MTTKPTALPRRRRVADVMRVLHELYPPLLHDPGDPPPLAFGEPDAVVRRILVALDADEYSVAEARRRRAEMLVVHHPPFYRPVRTLAGDTAAGRLARSFARAGLAVAALHLALDQAPDGTAAALAECLGLQDARVLVPNARESLVKLAVFVPESHREAVRQALADAGAGKLGDYSACSFTGQGEGAFLPDEKANPFIGRSGELARVPEWRIEVVFPERLLESVRAAMLRVHPYEEPAYDLFPTLNAAQVFGFGRLGTLPRAGKLERFARAAARAVGATGALWAAGAGAGAGATAGTVRRVAVWPGAGFPVDKADPAKMDAVVTGELGYHDQRSLAARGVGLVLLGHDMSERPVLPGWIRTLAGALPDVEVLPARDLPPSPCHVPAGR